MLLRSRRVVCGGGAGEEAAEQAHRRADAVDAMPPAAPARAAAPARVAAPKPPPWECVICWEPQPARQRGARRSRIAPSDLPCGHGCCAACLRVHVLAAVPPAARAARGTAALAGAVRCPGASAAPPGFDARCDTMLPRALVMALLPRMRGADGAGAPPARHWSGALRLGVKQCPWCGAASQLADGCSSVRCAICLRDWCFACGRRLGRPHEWHRGCLASQIADGAVVVLAALMLVCGFATLALLARGALLAAAGVMDDAPQPARFHHAMHC